MNKSDLINIVAAQAEINPTAAQQIVDLVFDSMAEALVIGDRIEIRGFGTFTAKNYGAYDGRNPKTGATIMVPKKRMPFFKVGHELKLRVNHENAD
jgi:integration host factor subunit beta